MDQLKQLLAKLTWNQRIWIGAAVLAVLGGLYSLNRWNQERDFKPLLTGLAPEDAGTVTAKLKELGVDYRLADGGSTIQVQSAKLAEMRLQLASAGLPKTGRIGFEIFDKANFGASEFAEQVNFNRAMEGELERSVMSIREVAVARVHITPAKDSLYTDQREAAKASVLVQLRRASALSPQNVQAICQLMASAVPGLAPELVTVVDTSGNLLNRPRAQGAGADSSEATMDYRKSLEKDLQNKIAATLDPLVGADHFRVGVSAEVDLSSGEQNEETYDPQKTVITNSQTTQDGPALPASAGVPGTASNVPRPTAVPVPTVLSSSNYTRRTENISYQPSRVIKHVRLPQGAVRRLSLSVLVDHRVRWEGRKRIVEAPTADKLKVIRELVAAVAGLDTTRGDQLVVDAFPFEATLTSGPPDTMLAAPEPAPAPAPSLLETLMNYSRFKLLAAIGMAVLLLSAGGFIVLYRKSSAAKKKASAASVTTKQASIAASLSDVPSTREEIERQIQERLEQSAAEHARKEAEALMNLQLPDTNTKKSEVLTKHLTAEAKKDPVAVAQVIRAWLDADKHEY